jgi:mono/diheme cytochrome c family protein
MRRERWFLVPLLAFSLSAGGFAQEWGAGWTIPSGAEGEKNPLEPTPDVLKRGKGVFERSCRKCHGPDGKGDGPDADPRNPAADLTDPSRLEVNPDGVLFYRIANGRRPGMPAFKSQLSRDEIWAAVEFVKSLHKAP